MILVLTGVDGSGKTTIAREITKHLVTKGFKVRMVWVKSLHTLAYLIYVFYSKLWGIEYIVNPTGRIVEHYCTQWMRKLGTLWIIIEFISVIPWIIIVYLYNIMGYLVICDRFLIDFLVTVSLRSRNILWPWRSIIGKFLLKIQSRNPTIHLYISIPTILQRRPNIEYTHKELLYSVILYHSIAKYVNTYEVRTENKPLKIVTHEIINYLTSYLK